MLVRKYDPATDHDGTLAILKPSIREQSYTARPADGRGVWRQERWQQEQLAALYDEERGAFREPERWYVADDGGQIVGVMKLVSEAENRALILSAIGTCPRGRGAGKAMLEEAKGEALRRGKRAIVLQTPRGGEPHRCWYPRRGFKPLPERDAGVMAGMILHL